MPEEIAPVGAFYEMTPNIGSTKEAAKAFESILLQQLFKSMSSSIQRSGLFGDGFEQQLYSDMFSSAIAEAASGSGLGMDSMIENALDPGGASIEQKRPSISSIMGARTYQMSAQSPAVSYRVETAPRTGNEAPSNVQLAAIAGQMTEQNAAKRWSPKGELSARDLSADVFTEVENGVAFFNVRDAEGYRDQNKCNLFAFELLRRAGFKVPVRARERGWGYPGAEAVTRMAAKDDVSGWAHVRTNANGKDLALQADSGAPLLLTASAPGDAMGHMAVADRIHAINRDKDGNITMIEYSGWDAGVKGSRYARKTWRADTGAGEGRGRFDRIEILEPLYANGQNPYQPLSNARPGASFLDLKNME